MTMQHVPRLSILSSCVCNGIPCPTSLPLGQLLSPVRILFCRGSQLSLICKRVDIGVRLNVSLDVLCSNNRELMQGRPTCD